MKERAIQNFWIVGLATLGVLALVLLRLNHESLAPIAGSRSQPIQKSALELESSVARVSPGRDQPNEVINPRAAREVGPEPALAIARVAQPASVAEPPPVARLQGHGESAVLLDRGGKPLLRATDAAPIYSAKPSPSGQQVLVGRGNGEHQIYLIEPFELVRELPLRPDGVPRASGFGSWAWVDETTLITAVDIERPATELSQLTGAERERSRRL